MADTHEAEATPEKQKQEMGNRKAREEIYVILKDRMYHTQHTYIKKKKNQSSHHGSVVKKSD